MKKIIYFLIAITLLLAAPSCKKENPISTQQYERINDYAQFISSGSKIIMGNGKAQVQLNVQLKNVNQIYHAHLYAYHNTYQLTLQWDDKPQSITDDFIQTADTKQQYYFKVILTNNEVVTGNPFTVNF